MGIFRRKAALAAFLALVVGGSGSCAQSAADFVGAGRRLLATNDLGGARDSFASAVALAPDDACANVLLGATRLLCLAGLYKIGWGKRVERVVEWGWDGFRRCMT